MWSPRRALQIDWSELMRFKRTFTEAGPEYSETCSRRLGSLLSGSRSFVGTHLQFNGRRALDSRYVSIAAGRKTVYFEDPPEVEHFTTYPHSLNCDELPAPASIQSAAVYVFEFAPWRRGWIAQSQLCIVMPGPSTSRPRSVNNSSSEVASLALNSA